MAWDEVKKINSDMSEPLNTKTARIETNIGTTTNTGGTTTTGTVMAKLNALLTKTQRQASLTGVGTTVFSGAPFPTSTSRDRTYPAIIAKFIAPISGVYTLTISGTYSESIIIKAGLCRNTGTTGTTGNTSTYSVSNDIDPFYVYANVSVGTIISTTPVVTRTSSTNALYTIAANLSVAAALGLNHTILGEITSGPINFYCEAGEPVVLYSIGDSTGESDLYLRSVIVTYENITD